MLQNISFILRYITVKGGKRGGVISSAVFGVKFLNVSPPFFVRNASTSHSLKVFNLYGNFPIFKCQYRSNLFEGMEGVRHQEHVACMLVRCLCVSCDVLQ